MKCVIKVRKFKHYRNQYFIQWNPFLTTARIATTVAITTDLPIPFVFFISVIQLTSAMSVKIAFLSYNDN